MEDIKIYYVPFYRSSILLDKECDRCHPKCIQMNATEIDINLVDQ